jgi:hypothetical protein
MSTLKAGFGRAIITPEQGLSLAGYFNERPNTGVLDDLQVKVLLLDDGDTLTGMISYDLCFVPRALMDEIRAALRAAGHEFAATIPLAATHTHTGPDVGGGISTQADPAEYRAFVAEQTVKAVAQALADMAPAELEAGSVVDNPYAFNRRYWMENGTVVTNPGKLNPKVVKAEGPVDAEIGMLSVKREGKLIGLVANICNHTDTTGGDKVSADWPGHMERAIQAHVASDIPVLPLIVPAGNINHFDITWDDPQTSAGEAKRIGDGYAAIICAQLDHLAPISATPLGIKTKPVTIHWRDISDAEIAAAQALSEKEIDSLGKDVTSEDLANGAEVVMQVFARQLLEYVKHVTPEGRDFNIAALTLGSDLAIVFYPGEPFCQVSIAVKEASPYKLTLVSELANGRCGYVAMPECFGRGGYETLPVINGGPREDTAELLIETGKELLT